MLGFEILLLNISAVRPVEPFKLFHRLGGIKVIPYERLKK
jgi:hypothetical protein